MSKRGNNNPSVFELCARQASYLKERYTLEKRIKHGENKEKRLRQLERLEQLTKVLIPCVKAAIDVRVFQI